MTIINVFTIKNFLKKQNLQKVILNFLFTVTNIKVKNVLLYVCNSKVNKLYYIYKKLIGTKVISFVRLFPTYIPTNKIYFSVFTISHLIGNKNIYVF